MRLDKTCQWCAAATCVALALLTWLAGSAQATPNIVFIIADDLGWTDTSVGAASLGNGSDFYETPHLESLAKAGMSFTHAYTAGANCAPTRAALLTGQYAPRPTNNVYAVGRLQRPGRQEVPLQAPAQGLSNGADQIPSSAITIAETLKTAGYTTAHFGKFHVGDPDGPSGNGPLGQGFDFNYGGNGTGNPGSTYFANARGVFASKRIGPELDPFASPGEHLTDATTDAAIDFLRNNSRSPFFMNVAFHAPHTPINRQGRPDLVAKYQAKPDGARHANDHYAALVEGVDQGVGRIVEFLATTPDPNNPAQMLLDNTLVVFTSDNGGLNRSTDNTPLQGQKGDYTEGGIRVPLFIALPGLVPPGAVNHTPVSTIDFYPTFASLAEAKLPAGHPVDGVNLTPLLSDASKTLERDALFWHFPGYLLESGRKQRPQSIVRKNMGAAEWKLIYAHETQSFELYNLADDIGEATNLAATKPEVVDALAGELRAWMLEIEAPMPTVKATGIAVPLPGRAPADLKSEK